MRCPECSVRNSVAASKCGECGHKFARKPVPVGVKIAAVVAAGSIAIWAAAAAIVPKLTDPERNLAHMARTIAAGPKSGDDAKKKRDEFDQAVRKYLASAGKLNNADLVGKLQKVLPPPAFEIHIADLPRGLRILEVDTLLQAADYLLMKSGSGVKVIALPGFEVFDDARLINESAGPMLVLLGHSSGQLPHKPLVKIYGLLPDDISDETDKLLPAFKGDGSAKFAKNGRDIVLDLSMLSLGQSEQLFAHGGSSEDGTVHQYLEWKDAHYTSRYEYGNSPFTALYAVARCLRYPDLVQSHSRYLGSKGERLVQENKSPDAGNFRVRKVQGGPDRATYNLASNVGSFKIDIQKANGVWSIASAALDSSPRPIAPTVASAPLMPPPAAPVVVQPVATPPAVDNSDAKLKSALDVLRKPEQLDSKIREVKLKLKDFGSPDTPAAKSVPTPPPAAKRPEPEKKPAPIVQPAAKKTEPEKKPVQQTAKRPEPPKQPEPPKVTEPAPAPAVVQGHGEVSRKLAGNTIKLRNAPGTSGSTITELSKGSSFDVLGKDNGWYKVRYQGKEGFVYGGLVDYKQPDAYTTATMTKSKAVVDSRQKHVATPQVGDRLVVLGGIENNKYKVKLSNGKTGYVDKDAIDVAVEAPPLVP